MPTAPAGAGESEPMQLPERGNGRKRDSREREEYIRLKKEPKSVTLYERNRKRSYVACGDSLWFCERTDTQLTDRTANDGWL